MLLMDEPFGALDALTREVLQAQFLQIWERIARRPVRHAQHDEAALLSDHIVIMRRRPGHIKAVLDVELPRPRAPEETRALPEFGRIRNFVWSSIREESGGRAVSESRDIAAAEIARKPIEAAPERSRILAFLASVAAYYPVWLLLALWEIVARTGLVDPIFMPPFSDVLKVTFHELFVRESCSHTWATASRAPAPASAWPPSSASRSAS